MLTMDELDRDLAAKGVLPYGSEAMARFETQVARYLGREYRRLEDQGTPPDDPSIVTDQGPMWAQTDRLMDRHYDESLQLFEGFLDRHYMAYSVGYYGETAQEVAASTLTIEQAQQTKLALIGERARLRGHERAFSIGCGFGPLETFLGEAYPGIQVTAITPSKTQIAYIRRCMADPSHPLSRPGLSLIEGDFGAIPADELGSEPYDMVFAIGMFEHINNLDAAFEKIASLLRPGGRAFVHLIVSGMVIPQFLDAGKTLIGDYFPGGKIWPFETIACQQKSLRLENKWFINGMNYWRTLDTWHRRFWDSLPTLYGGALDVDAVQHWNQYFCLCKACFLPFDGALYGNGQYLFRKPE